ncbi:MAG: zinc ABC transporter substrate-binding protein [Methanocorpusculum sp.]|nr:zinc ABC transporter substrate-binding protein [Methanocorpusculum sp.]
MKISLKTIIPILIILTLIFTAGCIGETETDSGKPVIAVSIVPEETFVKAVCGDLCDVIVMIPSGSSPETYEPTPIEMEKFSKADIYFSIGVQTEKTNILSSVSQKTKVVPLAEAVSAVYPDLDMNGGRDPHIWLSPKRAIVMVQKISDELSSVYPENAETFAASAEKYIAEIKQADEKVKSELNSVENKKFIAYHPAFGYFADEYGLKMFALEEDGKEATIQHLEKMIDLAKAEGIKIIFYQEEIDSSQAQSFAEELGGKTVKLSPLASDYTENLIKMAQAIAGAAK